jgi:phosphoesterase RecJ-like protein
VIESVTQLLNKHEKITILTHLNPDADTIGTALGVYSIVKNMGKQVEIVNRGKKLPRQLDFLPFFSKIKTQIDYRDSLIISCDVGSIDRLGFDVDGREILNIDHHKSNTNFGLINIVDDKAISASQVAYELFKNDYKITKEIATCFYTALVSDTQYFSTNTMRQEIFDIASELIKLGVKIDEVMNNIKQRKSLASIRILSSSLNTLLLEQDASLAIMVATKEKMLEAGSDIIDTVGVVDYAISLVTVEIAIFIIELETSIRVSIRSKSVDISKLALLFGGGGHTNAAGFEMENIEIEVLLEMIRKEIKNIGILDA